MKNNNTKSVAFGRLKKVPGRFLVHGIEVQEIPDNILKILCNLSWDRNVWYVNRKDNILYDCHINSCGKFNINYFAIEIYPPHNEEDKRQSSVFTVIVPKQ